MSETPTVTTDSGNVTIFSVEQLNRQIRQLIEGNLGTVWVRGELSNFKAHSSGHFYFSLKDAKSQLTAVMFRGHNSRLKFKPHDGLEVILRGKVTVYEPRGNYQIVAEMMEPVGAGALQKAYEQLREKLKAEGLFDPKTKRPLPPLPKHIALVTSPTGAAIRDMLNILKRRNPMVEITLVPTNVQGATAAPQICEALKKAYRLPDLDAVIVGRGGGSIEDLWAFNDETLARVIKQSPVPIISAVGHEIDFTIADFVADLRAPTPSAAAELVSKSVGDLVGKLDSLERLLKIAMAKALRSAREQYLGISRRLVDPKRRLMDLIQRNDELQMRLSASLRTYFHKRHLELKIAHGKLKNPQQVISEKRAETKMLGVRMQTLISRLLTLQGGRLSNAASVLDSLSPLKVVERGYSMTTKNDKLIKSVKQLKVGDTVNVRLMEGQFEAEVKKVHQGE